MGFHTISLIATEVLARRKAIDHESVDKCSMGLNTLVHSFLFLWTMVGAVWLLHDYDECIDGKIYTDYFMGFIIASAILIAYYGIFFIFTLCLCCIVTVSCYGSWRIGKFTRDYEEII